MESSDPVRHKDCSTELATQDALMCFPCGVVCSPIQPSKQSALRTWFRITSRWGNLQGLTARSTKYGRTLPRHMLLWRRCTWRRRRRGRVEQGAHENQSTVVVQWLTEAVHAWAGCHRKCAYVGGNILNVVCYIQGSQGSPYAPDIFLYTHREKGANWNSTKHVNIKNSKIEHVKKLQHNINTQTSIQMALEHPRNIQTTT